MLELTTPAVARPLLQLDYIESFLASGDQHDVARLSSILLRSQYQPIYSLAHQRVVGYEALVRPSYSNGDRVLPASLFGSTQGVEEKVFLDRVCRALHVRNFVRHGDDCSWLFLNVDPQVTTEGRHYGAFFRQLLEHYRIPPQRVVVEILEGRIHDEASLTEAVRYYKEMGCLVAIDDFGVGQSNFDRIWRIAPEIVKLDRSIIEQAAYNPTVRRILPSLVSLIHEAGSLVLIEGIENEEQALIATRSEIDFVQGYFFARPDYKLVTGMPHPLIQYLFKQLSHGKQYEEQNIRDRYAQHVETMHYASELLQHGCNPIEALEPFLQLPQARRCYLLDANGLQVGSNIVADRLLEKNDARFKPLNDATNAIWVRRPYFQRAITEPGRVHISKPYLSLTGGNLCVTLSIATHRGAGLQVLCADIDWQAGH